MLSVAVETAPTFTIGRRAKLFDTAPYSTSLFRRVAMAPDGRFLMLKESGGPDGAAAPQSIIVVQNWFEELRELVPLK